MLSPAGGGFFQTFTTVKSLNHLIHRHNLNVLRPHVDAVILNNLVLVQYGLRLRCIVGDRRRRVIDYSVTQRLAVPRDENDAHVIRLQIFPYSAIHIRERQSREPLAHVVIKVRDAVVAAVQRIAERGVLRLRQYVDVLHQILLRYLERFLRHSIAHKLVVFVKRRSKREHSLIRRDGANPYLEKLLLSSQIRIRLELEHAAREIFYVRIIAVVKPSRLPQTLVENTVGRTMFAEIRGYYGERRPIRVAACDAYGKA